MLILLFVDVFSVLTVLVNVFVILHKNLVNHPLLCKQYQNLKSLGCCYTFLECQWHLENIPCDFVMIVTVKGTTVFLCL